MKTKTRTWTVKVETMEGAELTVKFRARTVSEALELVCKEMRVGNVLSVTDSNRQRWV